jgi:E3 ubiquitin-protein ligase HERC2
VSSFSFGTLHALALAEDGIVHAWGDNFDGAVLGNPDVERELLPKPVEALRGVRVSSIAAASCRNYAVADTGELWVWGLDGGNAPSLGHGERVHYPLPKPMESLQGIQVDAMAANENYTVTLADDGSVYSWGDKDAFGLGPAVREAGEAVLAPQRVPGLRVGV